MKTKKLLIFLTTGAVIIAGAVVYFGDSGRKIEDEFYEVSPFRDDITITVSASGYVTPRNRLEVRPPLSGRVEEILVREGDRVQAGKIIAFMSSSERAALLDAARARGQDELQKWQEVYRPTPVIAPLEGFVIRRDVQPGQSLSSNEALVVMADELIVRAQVDETDLSKIQLGQSASVNLDAYPRRSIEGVVEHISHESEVISNVTVYNVDIKPMGGREIMRSGMNAMVQAEVGSSKDALLIPSSAIHQERGEEFVRLKSSEGKIETRRVSTGLSDGSNTEITSGLDEEDTVVLSLEARSGRGRRFGGGLPGIN